MYSLYEIPRRSRLCVQCCSSFAPGAVYYSSLSESFERSDYCFNCFQDQEEKGSIFWKAAIPEKVKVQTKQAERALELLRNIYREEEGMASILALYLQRQKLIIRRQEVEEATLYEVVETEEILSIKKVDPSQLDVESLQSEISKRLEQQ